MSEIDGGDSGRTDSRPSKSPAGLVAKGLAQVATARDSKAARGAADWAKNTGKAVGGRIADAAGDPKVRAEVAKGIGAAGRAAAVEAGLTNRKGELSKIRVARAATRPRKTVQALMLGGGTAAGRIAGSVASAVTETSKIDGEATKPAE